LRIVDRCSGESQLLQGGKLTVAPISQGGKLTVAPISQGGKLTVAPISQGGKLTVAWGKVNSHVKMKFLLGFF